MHPRIVPVVAAILIAACETNDPPPPSASCEELAAHAAGLLADERMGELPEAAREGQRAAMTDALVGPYRAACERMSAAERRCWSDAASERALVGCVMPAGADLAVVMKETAGERVGVGGGEGAP